MRRSQADLVRLVLSGARQPVEVQPEMLASWGRESPSAPATTCNCSRPPKGPQPRGAPARNLDGHSYPLSELAIVLAGDTRAMPHASPGSYQVPPWLAHICHPPDKLLCELNFLRGCMGGGGSGDCEDIGFTGTSACNCTPPSSPSVSTMQISAGPLADGYCIKGDCKDFAAGCAASGGQTCCNTATDKCICRPKGSC